MYKKEGEFTNKELIIRLVLACIVVAFVVDVFMNALWLMIMYDKAFLAVLSVRIVPQLIMIPIKIITIFTLVNVLRPVTKKYLLEE